MEEILASIRRIISEEDEPEVDVETPAVPEPEVEEPTPEPPVELVSEPEPEPPPPPQWVEAPVEPPAMAVDTDDTAEEELTLTNRVDLEAEIARTLEDRLVGDPAAEAAAAAFSYLSSTLLMPKDGRTLEDVVRELLRPLLKSWLDVNLPDIVEHLVRDEIERISKGGRGR